MSAARHMRIVTRCVRCQKHALSGFLSLAGFSLHAQLPQMRLVYPQAARQRYMTNSSRTFTTSSNSQSEQTSQIAPEQEEPVELDTRGIEESQQQLEEEESELELQEDEPPNSTSTATPWYLEEAEETISISSLVERQKLPELPEDAPQKLPDILRQLSTDIGLDYIRLIDLRALDPPPAIGAGVIMLLGTARSEKHLHVSADRFARWLRAAYKLAPRADGLLGRNEMKIQMRRKAKRAKLLGSVGAVQKDGEEDAKSGWICVDAGIIERTSVVERSLDESGIIGFGDQASGVKLVVQIMTEDKRRELDLETLWERTLERHRKRLAEREVARATVDDNKDSELDGGREQPSSASVAANLA